MVKVKSIIAGGPGKVSPAPSRLPTASLSEAQLHTLWLGQRFPAEALTTKDGRRLQVVYRGRPATGPGPDFRDALIALPDARLLKGDVELHIRASDFHAHGHDRDPAYNGLILHVVFQDDLGLETRLASGRTVPVIALGMWVARRADELEGWLRQPPLWREPYQTAVDRLGEDEVSAVLERLGMRRFRAKAAAFVQGVRKGPGDEVVYRALLRALGYGGNEEAYEELAQRLPWQAIRAELTRVPPLEHAAAARDLLLESAGLRAGRQAAMDNRRWRTWGLRPENQPVRRLTGGATLLAAMLPAGPALWAQETVLAAGRLLAQVTPEAAMGPGLFAAGRRERLSGAAKGLIAALTVREEGKRSALIGPERAVEIAMNVVLPFAAGWGTLTRDRLLTQRAESLAAVLPARAPYGITRRVAEALRDKANRPLARTALQQQGLLYLFQHYCTQGGCGVCPLS